MSTTSTSSKKIRRLGWSEIGQVIRQTFVEFFQEKSFFHGAALAYYTIFAMVPMIYLSLISFGKIVGQDNMLRIIDHILQHEVGLTDSSGIMSFLQKINFEKGNIVLNIVGIIALLLSSSALLASLRTSINEFYDIKVTFSNRKRAFFHNVGSRLINIFLLPVLGLVIIITYFGETVLLSVSSRFFGELDGFEYIIMQLLQHGSAILTNVVLFTIIFKFLHDGKVARKIAFSGALVTALLLYGGQLLIRYYLKNYFFGSSIGLPGTLLILLAWMYYSSQIIFLGAKFTKVYAAKVGHPIVFQAHTMRAKRTLAKVNRTLKRS